MKNYKLNYIIFFLSLILYILYFLFPQFLLRKYLFYIPDFINNFSLNVISIFLFIAVIISLIYTIFSKKNNVVSNNIFPNIINIIILIGITFFSYKISMTNPDISSYIYFGAYFEKYGLINYISNFSSPIIDSWVSAPIIGIINGLFFKISNDNFLIFHLLQVFLYFLFGYGTYLLYNIVYNKNHSKLLIANFLTIPFLFSQFYMPLTDIPASIFFLYAIISIIYGIKNNKTIFIILSSLLFILSFLTKYLMMLYIFPSLLFIFIIYKGFRFKIFITSIITLIGILSWIFYKPAAFYVLFEKVLFEKNAINNSLLGNISISQNTLMIIILGTLLILILGLLYKKVFINLYKNLKNNTIKFLKNKYVKLFIILFIILTLFINFGFDKKIFFHRSYFVGIGILFILFLFSFLRKNTFKKEEILFLLLFLISFLTPNLMFKYLIPVYPFIAIIGYNYLVKINYKLVYALILINIFTIFTFIIPQINQTYGTNFIKSTNYIKENNIKGNISIGYLGEDKRHKMIRSFDYTLIPYFSIYNNIKYNFINMGYSITEGHRKGYKIKNYKNILYNNYENIFKTKNIERAIKNNDTILLVLNNDNKDIDLKSKRHKENIIKKIKNNCYKKVFDSGFSNGGIWNNKTVIFMKDKKCIK